MAEICCEEAKSTPATAAAAAAVSAAAAAAAVASSAIDRRRRRLEIRRFRVASDLEPSAAEDDRAGKRQRLARTASGSCPDDGSVSQQTGSGVLERWPRYGVTLVCGRRREMEDAVSVRLDFLPGSSKHHFFGVFDGHGCSHVATTCQDRMHEVVAEEHNKAASGEAAAWKEVMERSFARMDEDMLPFTERDTNLRDGNNNLKRRGAGAGIATFTSPKPKAAPKKRFQDDSENQDPALATPPPPPAASRPPFGAPRWAKNAKEAIKSSAEKRPNNAEKEALLSKNAAPRQLKSTLSARNLFSGKDILGQISEFYNELKRMAGGSASRPVSETMEELSPSPINGSDAMEKVACDSGTGVRVPLEAVREVARQETVETSPSPMKGKKMGLKVEAGKQRSPNVLKEVKATPPTPQRFPSPSVNRVKNVKAGGRATAGSPLKKPLKEKGSPNKDLESSRDAKRQPFGVKDMNNTRVCDAEGSSSSMFWFLKPCTFLVE